MPLLKPLTILKGTAAMSVAQKPQMTGRRKVFLVLLPVFEAILILLYILLGAFIRLGNELFSHLSGPNPEVYNLHIRILYEPAFAVYRLLLERDVVWAFGGVLIWALLVLVINGPVVLPFVTAVAYVRSFRKYRW